MTCLRISLTGLAILLPLLAGRAFAKPNGPVLFCEEYPSAPNCQGELPACSTCHTSTWPARWNSFGGDLRAALNGDFDAGIGDALAMIEHLDSDRDGIQNRYEIDVGTAPGDASDVWPYCFTEHSTDSVPTDPRYDFELALRRVTILYCGRSPSYDEVRAFIDDQPSREVQYERVHAQLERCLQSEYWRDEGLLRLADRRIRPIEAVGASSGVGITIADYTWDYQLFAYVLTADRDARDLLLADYHVERRADGTLVPIEGEFSAASGNPVGGQPLDVERRAGMITTQWFLAVNTMFSSLPRTTAAHAYRSYLGADIALQEGLFPIPGEPVDIDSRYVAEAPCSHCHSTLDPLSYAFSYYEGIDPVTSTTGTYREDRPNRVMPAWEENQTYLVGQPVGSVREWAELAVTTDMFKRNLADMFFVHAFEREPRADELPEFEAAWLALPDDGWSANRLIHRIIDFSAMGAF